MMFIGMHCRIVGKPGRLRGLQRFLDHVQSHNKVWVYRLRLSGHAFAT
jgi:peptidoglycan/xylan/chitin deacetylase (PgdA/CDA1 family)